MDLESPKTRKLLKIFLDKDILPDTQTGIAKQLEILAKSKKIEVSPRTCDRFSRELLENEWIIQDGFKEDDLYGGGRRPRFKKNEKKIIEDIEHSDVLLDWLWMITEHIAKAVVIDVKLKRRMEEKNK